MTRRTQWTKVYVVIRIDRFEGRGSRLPEESGPGVEFGEYAVTVKEVVMTAEAAIAEVERLTSISAGKSCRYYWQGTHLFADGGSFGAEGGDR